MSSVEIGTFAVSAAAAEVAAFRKAARLDESDALPFTWPIRWMARSDIRAALTALVPEPDIVPFHESQTFDYAAPLRAGATYALAVTARRESAPDRLVAEGVLSADGARVATIETVLRLFSTTGAQDA
ncbi:hypothetical protein RHAL1_03530 [Beijerinckiaceae bacterium RH AL1]|nr:hypothetical protein [Beijerinckiaceae bacterium]VVB48855.1 hypothetical protein RHCH11_RHCH11_03465 [Beijerinckiaceae bacterium RH CH11]VVB48932.1 hypothetical protein RHAL8_03461 [Beijerinckiaceae bacterium RH AL8]VVC56601.1 hypothetical protein RHAL1_03530 [Beijerinckiaceae bacterium RH AL1]